MTERLQLYMYCMVYIVIVSDNITIMLSGVHCISLPSTLAWRGCLWSPTPAYRVAGQTVAEGAQGAVSSVRAPLSPTHINIEYVSILLTYRYMFSYITKNYLPHRIYNIALTAYFTITCFFILKLAILLLMENPKIIENQWKEISSIQSFKKFINLKII